MQHFNTMDARQKEFMDRLRPIHRQLEKFILSMTRDRDDAHDLMQDTILIAWQRMDTLRDPAAFKTYLYTIASNRFKRRFVREKYFGVFSEELQDQLSTSDPSPERSTDASLVREALQRLPWKYREAIILYEINDLSIEEVRRIQGGTTSAVKVRLLRARRLLAKLLGVAAESTSHPSYML
jgi:RNA polymerase sigma-70 factor (ECF subfamily)